MGGIPVVPSRRGAKNPQPCPAYIYRHRNLIERCWSRLKERRAIATRYDKTAVSYATGITIAVSLDWIKSSLHKNSNANGPKCSALVPVLSIQPSPGSVPEFLLDRAERSKDALRLGLAHPVIDAGEIDVLPDLRRWASRVTAASRVALLPAAYLLAQRCRQPSGRSPQCSNPPADRRRPGRA